MNLLTILTAAKTAKDWLAGLKWKAVGAVAALLLTVAAAMTIWAQHQKISALRSTAAGLTEDLRQSRASLDLVNAAVAADHAAQAKELALAAARNKRKADLHAKIAAAPDCQLDPSLRDLFAGMR